MVIASTESSTATWACACNTQSALWWDWNPFVRKLIKVGSLGENAKNKKKSPINDFNMFMALFVSKIKGGQNEANIDLFFFRFLM